MFSEMSITAKADGNTEMKQEDKQATDMTNAGSLPRDVSSKSLSEVVCLTRPLCD